MDGWGRLGSDDDFPIRQGLPVGARFWCWAHWAQFFITIYICILVDTVHLHVSHHF
jgi:hypothetical protein